MCENLISFIRFYFFYRYDSKWFFFVFGKQMFVGDDSNKPCKKVFEIREIIFSRDRRSVLPDKVR